VLALNDLINYLVYADRNSGRGLSERDARGGRNWLNRRRRCGRGLIATLLSADVRWQKQTGGQNPTAVFHISHDLRPKPDFD